MEARDLELGSGGFDIVHANLSRGLAGEGTPGAHVMKLNYTSLQHAVLPVEEEEEGAGAGERPAPALPLARPVAVFGLHGQLPPLAWAIGQARPGTQVGYVQTVGGALPGGLSRDVRELRARELLCAHVTAGPAYGAEAEAITTAGALHQGLHDAGWDVAVCGPGPGILGSASALGHGGIALLKSFHHYADIQNDQAMFFHQSRSTSRQRYLPPNGRQTNLTSWGRHRPWATAGWRPWTARTPPWRWAAGRCSWPGCRPATPARGTSASPTTP